MVLYALAVAPLTVHLIKRHRSRGSGAAHRHSTETLSAADLPPFSGMMSCGSPLQWMKTFLPGFRCVNSAMNSTPADTASSEGDVVSTVGSLSCWMPTDSYSTTGPAGTDPPSSKTSAHDGPSTSLRVWWTLFTCGTSVLPPSLRTVVLLGHVDHGPDPVHLPQHPHVVGQRQRAHH